MFTGLVEEIGTISVCRSREGGREIAVSSPKIGADGLGPGDSVAVAGVCLTVERVGSGRFWARVMPQTAATTTLDKARPGQRVNLERALKVGDRLGGHFVLGHVDETVTVLRADRQGDSRLVEVEFAPSLGKYIVPRGSVCLDGVSLTVADLNNNRLTVSLVKETLERTTLGELQPGDKMNLEVDILAKHIAALLPEGRKASHPAPSSLDSLLSTEG